MCPICSVELKMSDRAGIEIDYCPKCRGVWLDRGELDKIIEKSSGDLNSGENRNEASGPENPAYKEKYYEKSRKHDDEKYYGNRKRKSFLGDLFDF